MNVREKIIAGMPTLIFYAVNYEQPPPPYYYLSYLIGFRQTEFNFQEVTNQNRRRQTGVHASLQPIGYDDDFRAQWVNAISLRMG
jgi:hypothetical protein